MTDNAGATARAEDEASLVALLNATWFGAGLEPETQVRLARLARRYQAAAGTQLLGEGELTTELSIVVSGRVTLRTLVPERGSVPILTVEPGDVFGWSAVVEPFRATSTVVAQGPVDVLALEAKGLRAALATDCGLAVALYPRMLQALARRLSATRLQLLDLFAGEQGGTW